VSDVVPLYQESSHSYLLLVKVRYTSGPDQTYHIPLVRMKWEPLNRNDGTASLRLRSENSSEEIVLTDALSNEQFLSRLLDSVARGHSFPGARGEVRAACTSALRQLWEPSQRPLTPSLMNVEQSNSSIVFEKRLVLKIFRRVEEGINPDLEIGSFLTERTSFRNIPLLAGSLEYLINRGTRMSLGGLQGYVTNQGDAWQFTLRALAEYYGKMRQAAGLEANEIPRATTLALCDQPIPDEASKRIGQYLESAALLGKRTAELHMALSSERQDPAFSPEDFSEAKRKALVESAVDLLASNFDLLRRHKSGMPEHIQREADNVLRLEQKTRQRFQLLRKIQPSSMLTRIHGDYHLGQVLFTGSDFVIIDFEGEPARPLEDRRQKRSPLQDVAGMLRSFHYAAYAPLLQQASNQTRGDDKLQVFGSWAHYWQVWVSVAFLKTYLDSSADCPSIPVNREELAVLLDTYLLDKAVYELGYELNNRPAWVRIPLDGISQLLRSTA